MTTDAALVPSTDLATVFAGEVPAPLQAEYRWASAANQREFLDCVEAYSLAVRYGLDYQVQQYPLRARDVLAKDLAEGARDLIQQQFGVDSEVYPATDMLGEVPAIFARGGADRRTHAELSQYSIRIPVEILRKLDHLRQHVVAYDSAYLALEGTANGYAPGTTTPTSVLHTCYLAVRYGRWVVTIDSWPYEKGGGWTSYPVSQAPRPQKRLR